ncbi:tetratricopeptide repeat protein, partial [bacterium]|nr:tetratricopeptide repeat protein [bacterium]
MEQSTDNFFLKASKSAIAILMIVGWAFGYIAYFGAILWSYAVYDAFYPPTYMQDLPPYDDLLDPSDPVVAELLQLSKAEQYSHSMYLSDALIKLCEIYYPQQPVDNARRTIHISVLDLKQKLKSAHNANGATMKLSNLIYNKMKFHYIDLDKLPYRYPNIVKFIEYREGVCFHLCVLYIILGEQLDLPLTILMSEEEEHSIILYDDGKRRFYIEPSAKGVNSYLFGILFPGKKFLSTFEPIDAKGILSYLVAVIGENKMNEEDRETAERLLHQAIELDKKNPRAYVLLTSIYLANDMTDQAYEIARKGNDIARPMNTLKTMLGLALAKKCRYEEAIPYLKHGIEEEYKKFECLHGSGVCYFNLNQFSEAETYLKQSLEGGNEQNHVQALGLLGMIYTKQERFDEARSMARQAIEIEPNNPELHFLIASCFFNQKNYQKAIPYFETAEKLNPKNEKTLFYTAYSYSRIGQVKKKNEYIHKLESLGFVVFENGESEMSLARVNEAMLFPFAYPGNPFKA